MYIFHSGIRSRGLFWQVGNCFVMLAGRASFPLVGREPSLRHTRLGCAYATKMTRLRPPNIIEVLNGAPLNTAHLVIAC